jgi:hypothetical protein
MGDVAHLPVAAVAATIAVTCTWQKALDLDLCLAMFTRDNTLLGSCFFDSTKPTTLNHAVELDAPTMSDTGGRTASLKIRLHQLPNDVHCGAIYVVSRGRTSLSAFDQLRINLTGSKGEALGGFVADMQLATVFATESLAIATISRANNGWALSNWPDSSEGLPGTPTRKLAA